MGQEKTRCKEVITACDKALKETKKKAELSDLGLNSCILQKGALNEDVANMKEKLDSPIRNPIIVGIIAALVGALTFGALKK